MTKGGMKMKIQKLFLILISMVLFLVTGCVNGVENEGQNIKIQKRIGDENKYENYKEITNNKQVKEVKKILDKVDWEIVKVDMARPADYRFFFQFKDPKKEAKAVLYELWISPNKDKVVLVIDAASKYSQLNEEVSVTIFEILTEEKLFDIK